MSLTPKSVRLLKPYFDGASYDLDASRTLFPQASGFIWSDEKPKPVDVVDELARKSIGRFMIAVISFRATMINEAPHEPFRPYWDEFSRCCPHWPGFRAERRDPILANELLAELDDFCDDLDKLAERCERKRTIERRRKDRK